MAKNYILDEQRANMKLERMAFEILENNLNEKELLIVGVRDNGSAIAGNVQKLLQSISKISTKLIHLSLDKKHPGEITLSEQLDFNDKVIILVDDVANSGKTMLYAMKPFLEAHPKKIQTLVLVERTHKAFPVNTDYVGVSVATTFQEHIYVEVQGEVVKGAWME
jgi:pyrimidine operon attenuation protein / uracil phosphoribosyltransferase